MVNVPCSLHVISSLRLSSGGPTHSVTRLCEALNELGAPTEIATVAGAGEQAPPPGITPVHAFPLAWPPRLRRSPELEAFLDHEAPRFDLIHVHGLWQWPGTAARRVAIKHGLPLVISPRGMLEPWALGQRAWLKGLALRTWEGRNLGAARLLHATSDVEAQQLAALKVPGRIVVVPNGVDLPEEGVPGPAPGRKTLLYLSRFHPKKGGDLLLQAWSRLWRVFPDWRLRLVGPDAEGTRDAWRQLATGLGIDAESIQFEGPIEGAEKAACLTGAELFVLPSHSENFGNVVAESLAHGTPVVTTTATPWRGLEEKGCGWWVAPEASAIEAALGQAMALSRPDRLAMGRLGRAWMASDFSWRSVAQCFKEDYSRLSGAMGGRLGQPCSRGPNVP